MYRIDFKKWKAAVDEVEANKAQKPQLVKDLAAGKIDWKKYRDDGGWRNHAEELTLLYSIRAHGRGRIHRLRAQPIGEGLKRDLTVEDQVKYIGDRWKAFERVVELKVA